MDATRPLSTRGPAPRDLHHFSTWGNEFPNRARPQTGEGQSTSGSSNSTLDRHQGPRISADLRRRRDQYHYREEMRRARHLRRRLDDNQNPAAFQSMEPICVLDTRHEEIRVLEPALSLFCLEQEYSLVHPKLLRRLGIEPEDVPPGTGREFIYPNGRCDAQKFTNLVIEHPSYNIWGKVEYFLVLGEDVPHKGIDIYFGQPFLTKYFNGSLPQHFKLPPDAAGGSGSGQAGHWPVGIRGGSQSVIGSENTTLSTAPSESGFGLGQYPSPFIDVPVAPMVPLTGPSILGTNMTGAPGYCTAPPPSEQWGTSPGLPGGVQYPIRSNGENNGALEQFEPFNDPRLDPNGRYGPAGGYQVYPSDNNMPEDPYNLHWSQTPY